MGRVRFSFLKGAVIAALAVLSACATAPKPGEYSSRELMDAACPAGFASEENPRVVKGSIWTKIHSKEMSGQFPATVLVEYPKKLAVEVTNLIGAPQAWLKVEDGKTKLRFTAENEKEYGKPKSAAMLGGLPVEQAPRLFAGGVPCPSDNKNQDIRVKQTSDGGLEVIAFDLRSRQQTRYAYQFTRYAGHPWVAHVEWGSVAKDERAAKIFQLTREEPSDPDGAPKRWTASSDRGEIQVRWKDRSVEKN